jgi:hypothetical protein
MDYFAAIPKANLRRWAAKKITHLKLLLFA